MRRIIAGTGSLVGGSKLTSVWIRRITHPRATRKGGVLVDLDLIPRSTLLIALWHGGEEGWRGD